MIQIIDNTLTAMDQFLPTKEDLHSFCELLITIGVDMIEMSVTAYKRMEFLPEEGKFLLNISDREDKNPYPGFYRYISRYGEVKDDFIPEIQLNDVREIVKLREFHGQKDIRIVGLDDLICYSYDKVMKEITRSLPGCNIIFCPENSYQCAGALAIHWAMNYGKSLTTSFAGCKNNAATEEVIMALRLAARHKPNRNLTVLPRLTALYEKITGQRVGNKKPVIGDKIFHVEAGIHADGIIKNPNTYEAFCPLCVGKSSKIIIGKHSGTKAIKLKLAEMKLPIPNESGIHSILGEVKLRCMTERKSLSDQEFYNLVLEVTSNERGQTYR